MTWMDAKVGDWVVTPRRGKAVEINALWYNALRLLEQWTAEEFGNGIRGSESGESAVEKLTSKELGDRARASAASRSTHGSGVNRPATCLTW